MIMLSSIVITLLIKQHCVIGSSGTCPVCKLVKATLCSLTIGYVLIKFIFHFTAIALIFLFRVQVSPLSTK